MQLLNKDVRRDLFNPEHPIFTKIKDEVPASYGPSASVRNSLVADGCIIDGVVENCVLFRGVRIAAGSVLKNCIVMQGCDIREACDLEYVIFDKSVTVSRGQRLAGNKNIPLIIRKGMTV